MRRTILLAGVLPFISAFLGGVLAFSLLAAPAATAQSSQAQEVQASAFTLVGTDGTVLARLAAGGAGNGNLSLFDTAGKRRISIAGDGMVRAFEQDGTTPAFRAGREYFVVPSAEPPVNGVQLGPDGSISMIPPRP